MNPRYLVLILALAFAALPTAALAEGGDGEHGETEAGEPSAAAHGGGGGHINWIDFNDQHAVPLIPMFVNFALLLVIIYFILRKPIGGGARERRARLEKEIEEARQVKEAAEEALVEAKSKIDSLDAEMDRLRREIQDGGKSEAARISADAEARAERLRADTAALVEQEVARMSRTIREDVVSGIVDRAEAIIREKIGGDDQTRLAQEYVRELSDTAADKPGT